MSWLPAIGISETVIGSKENVGEVEDLAARDSQTHEVLRNLGKDPVLHHQLPHEQPPWSHSWVGLYNKLAACCSGVSTGTVRQQHPLSFSHASHSLVRSTTNGAALSAVLCSRAESTRSPWWWALLQCIELQDAFTFNILISLCRFWCELQVTCEIRLWVKKKKCWKQLHS